MILNGAQIKSEYEQDRITIQPYEKNNIGPNSYDITLSKHLKIIAENDVSRAGQAFIDPDTPQNAQSVKMPQEGYILQPGNLYLGSTVEAIGSEYYVPMLEGRSSVGRMGLFIHVTAGFGDIGFQSNWTLELCTIMPIRVYPGMRIGQVFFYECSSRDTIYRGRYQYQPEPQESLYWKKVVKTL